MRSIIMGTAGHIDHGKTALTTALTGIDTDRLPQEKTRGISIELGFAPLRYSDDFIVGIIDVPGHERFVKTMVMGATQIDLVLFVVAANEGMMPQSREHLSILTGLGLKRGIVVLSKADLLSEEDRLVAVEQVQKELKGTFLEKAPVLFVSAKTSEGLPELRQKIFEYTHYQPEVDRVKGLTRVWIDRVFTLVGHGTVVTGPLISGRLRLQDELELYPKNKIVRVRRIHAYGRAFDEISAPSRVALNIKGISKEEIHRGDVLAKPETLISTSRATARLQMLPLFGNREIVRTNKVRSVGRYFPEGASATLPAPEGNSSPHTLNLGGNDKGYFSFHVGTTRALVSIKGGGDGISFLKFSKPLVLLPGDRFILRRETTVGAGEIVAIKGRREEAFPSSAFSVGGDMFPSRAGSVADALSGKYLPPPPTSRSGKILPPSILPSIDESLRLAVESLFTELTETYEAFDLIDLCKKMGKKMEAPKQKIEPVLKALIGNQRIIKLPGGFYIPFTRLEILKSKLKTFFENHAEMGVGDLKNMLSVSRKLAIPYLQFFDEQKWTIRKGDVRVPWKITD